MKVNHFGILFLCLVLSGTSACKASHAKTDPSISETSHSLSFDLSDPILFVESWVLSNGVALGITVDDPAEIFVGRILFNGDIYEAVVSIGNDDKDIFLISFQKQSSNWVFRSQKRGALDHGWPSR